MTYATVGILIFICFTLLAIHGALSRVYVALEVIAGLYIQAMTKAAEDTPTE